nr:uncharacterized protein LOC118681683 [Bactrocera oleae]
MCNSCERTVYSGRKPEILGELSVNKCPEVNEPEKSNDVIEDDKEKDPTFHCKPVDNKLNIDKANKFLTKIGEPPIKTKRVSSNKECQNVLTYVVTLPTDWSIKMIRKEFKSFQTNGDNCKIKYDKNEDSHRNL